MSCVVCQKDIPTVGGAGRPRRYCSTACRKRAYRQRQEERSGGSRTVEEACCPAGGASIIALVFFPAGVEGQGAAVAGPLLDFGRFVTGLTQIHSPACSANQAERPEETHE